MSSVWMLTPIAHIHTEFSEKFGIPRQSGLVPDLRAEIVFCEGYRDPDALRGIEGFSHLWLLWGFSETQRPQGEWSPTVRPPRLGGNTRMGVFATRAPYRPNPIGLSSVRLLEVKETPDRGTVLLVGGADLLNGTPIYDIKPYLAYTDSHPEAVGGFADPVREESLNVDFPSALLSRLPEEKRQTVLALLAQDPRPHYHNDPERIYGMRFAKWEIHFKVNGKDLTVTDVTNKGGEE